MLVLSRRVGERIVIPGLDVTIKIVSIRKNKVRLGISAPAEVPIYREELLKRIGAGQERHRPSPASSDSGASRKDPFAPSREQERRQEDTSQSSA